MDASDYGKSRGKRTVIPATLLHLSDEELVAEFAENSGNTQEAVVIDLAKSRTNAAASAGKKLRAA